MEQKKALIAMSGGVDSSAAALLMQQAGYTCVGGTLILCKDLMQLPAADPAADARAVAEKLNMEFYLWDAQTEFRQAVVDDFVRCYETGLTPNPCVRCNQNLKFSFLLDRALELGCDKLVTGHYAQIRQDPATGRFLLQKAVDETKDQSYFLACLNQHQLSHACFPLGTMTKPQIRAVAEQAGLCNAKKRDSQDICFIPDGDYVSFLKRYTGKEYPNGKFLDLNGNQVGIHQGAIRYTLGQRKGLGLAMGAPVYVCSKSMEDNTVTVGPEEALFANTLLANDWNWFPFPVLNAPMDVMAKARSRHIPQPATVYPEENGFARVVFHTPQRALTPGQSIVLYQEDTVIGGGIIRKIL